MRVVSKRVNQKCGAIQPDLAPFLNKAQDDCLWPNNRQGSGVVLPQFLGLNELLERTHTVDFSMKAGQD